MIILDVGKNEAHFFNVKTEETGSIKLEDLVELNIPGIDGVNQIVIEDAHLRSRERNSLAQPFDYDQLIQLKINAEAKGINIKLFPQMSTPKARMLCGITEKNDINDVTAIGNYIIKYPRIINSLKNFNPKTLDEFRTLNKCKWKDREQLTKDVNGARNLGYEGDEVSAFIDDNVRYLYENLDDVHREMLGLTVKFAGKPKEYVSCTRNRLYTVVSTLMKPDGSLRLRSDVQKLPYWRYVKETYFGMTPYHMNAGVVASNVKHHWRRALSTFRKTTSANPLLPEEHEDFVTARTEFDKKLRHIFNTIRALVLQQQASLTKGSTVCTITSRPVPNESSPSHQLHLLQPA